MNELGKFLVVIGLLIAIAGVLLWSGLGRNWLGRLPGDIQFSKGNFHFYFPICHLPDLKHSAHPDYVAVQKIVFAKFGI